MPLHPKGTLRIPAVSERSLTLGRGFTARRDGDASLGYCSSDRHSRNGLAGENQRFVEWLRQAWRYIRRAQWEHVRGGNIGGDRG